MADIELVIKIDEDDYKIMKHNIAINNPLCPLSQEEMVSKVANGVPLPKGHGKIIDADYAIKQLLGLPKNELSTEDAWAMKVLDLAPTIIEADKEE